MEIVRLRGHLAHVRPRVFFLDALIGNFLERVLVCVFFILLLLLFSGCLLVAFLAELATTLAVSHLGVRGHRQSRAHVFAAEQENSLSLSGTFSGQGCAGHSLPKQIGYHRAVSVHTPRDHTSVAAI